MADEKRFEKKIRDYLTSIGAYNVKYFGCAFSEKGVPDIMASYRGTFYGIEVKASKGRPSMLQIINLININKTGGKGWLLYPEMFDDFKKYLSSDVTAQERLEIFNRNKDCIEKWRLRLVQQKN